MALDSAEFYSLILAALNYLQDDDGLFERGFEKAGLDRREVWLLNRFRYFPGSVAPADFLTFGPYTSISHHAQSLETLVEKKYAEKVDASRFRASETGRKLMDGLYRDYFGAIARHNALPEAEVRRLGALADRAVTGALRQREVPTPITSAVRSTFPNIEQPWVFAERRVVAMAVFREDAHIAAWRDDGWSGPRIAVSTTLFKAPDYRLPADELRAAVARLDDKDFNSAVAALHSGGEAAHNLDGLYRLTTAGVKARQLIEDQTNRNYARLMEALDAPELDDLIALLEQVRGPVGA